jgi:hypothetical protein
MPIKMAIPRSEELLDRINQALTPDRLPLLIAIDGADLSGKSSLASWLAWQVGMPAAQLDLYLTCLHPIQWRSEDLARVVAKRIDIRTQRSAIASARRFITRINYRSQLSSFREPRTPSCHRIKRKRWSKYCAARANQLVICCFRASNTAFARPPPSSGAWTRNSNSTRSRSSRSA